MSGAPPPYPGPEKGPAPAYPGQGAPAYPGQGGAPQYGQPGTSNMTSNMTSNTTVIIGQPAAVTVIQQYREAPVRMQCPFCRADIITSISYETRTFTWVACFVIAVVGFWLGCCLIPFFVNACKDCVHHCPNCRQQVGRYNRM